MSLSKEDYINIVRDSLIKFTSPADDKRSYTSINFIGDTFEKVLKYFFKEKVKLSNELLETILDDLGYDSYEKKYHHKDEKYAIFDKKGSYRAYSVNINDISQLDKMKTTFSHKWNRREDRQKELEKLTFEYRDFLYDFVIEKGLKIYTVYNPWVEDV